MNEVYSNYLKTLKLSAAAKKKLTVFRENQLTVLTDPLIIGFTNYRVNPCLVLNSFFTSSKSIYENDACELSKLFDCKLGRVIINDFGGRQTVVRGFGCRFQ